MSRPGFTLSALVEPQAASVPLVVAGFQDKHDQIREELAPALCRRWLERFGAFDCGALTVWLMRGFGLPNVRAYDTVKHGFRWGLATPDGHVIVVEPGLVRVSAQDNRSSGLVEYTYFNQE